MKAAVRTRYGRPEVVRIADVDTPAVGDREVLVKVHVTTVNRTDCGFRSGKPFIVRFFSGLSKPKVMVLGGEFAGVVEAVGRSVASFEVGDKVFGFSEWRWGAHAEYLSIREDGSFATMPANVTYERSLPVPRVRTMPSRSSGRRRSAAGKTCSSMARPERSARRRSSS